MDIINKDNGKSGAFLAMEDGLQLGEMTYQWAGNDKIIIDHTHVILSYEGKGVGRSMFEKAIRFARRNDIKIVPVCPFVVALFKRMTETQDVLAVGSMVI